MLCSGRTEEEAWDALNVAITLRLEAIGKPHVLRYTGQQYEYDSWDQNGQHVTGFLGIRVCQNQFHTA